MTLEFKYIIIDQLKAVIFNHGIEHIAEANGRNVTSAGFVRIGLTADSSGDVKMGIRCFGRSESLNIDSNPKRDALIIEKIAANCVGLGGE